MNSASYTLFFSPVQGPLRNPVKYAILLRKKSGRRRAGKRGNHGTFRSSECGLLHKSRYLPRQHRHLPLPFSAGGLDGRKGHSHCLGLREHQFRAGQGCGIPDLPVDGGGRGAGEGVAGGKVGGTGQPALFHPLPRPPSGMICTGMT